MRCASHAIPMVCTTPNAIQAAGPRALQTSVSNPRHAQESRAKKCAMAQDEASVVICEACGEHAAEIVVDGKRALCSECHLMESGTRLRREEKPEPEE